MNRYKHFIIGTFFFTLVMSVTCAAPAVCPATPDMIDITVEKDTLSDIAKTRSNNCFAARLLQTETKETDYICPSGDFSNTDRPYTDEILAYQIAVATVFQAIDTNALLYAQSLQCNRDTDPIKWQQTIKIFTDENTGYAKQYYSTCSISWILSLLNTDPNNPIIRTTNTLPQADCMNLAKSKTDALHNLWILLMSNWVGKWFQNGKDVFLDEVKTKYSGVLDKVSVYLRIVGRAVAKLDKYLKNTIQ